jgi:BirA family biotin operon repressor/biotin-[acetyl-CoA-carboxylase] ligase
MGQERQLLDILNDGKFHSGEELAAQLGRLSRAAIWKIIRNLEALDLEIHAVRGRGYRLAEPVELLEQDRINAALTDTARSWVNAIEIHERIDSTNTYLFNRAKDGLASGSVCLAEWQSAGRGRRGRSWVSPFAASLYLSLLWRFSMEPALLSGVSLAVGVALVRALHGLGIAGLGLKWPNDLLWRYRKLAGVLLEFGGEASGPCYIVAGVGLNMAMPTRAERAIDQPWVDLRRIVGSERLSRNRLAARVISELVTAFTHFEEAGFEAFRADWQRYDLAQGRAVVLQLPTTTISGIARGVDASGALLLETATGIHRFLGGEISLRLAS